ncbi:hypothetical protein FRC19_010430 [Serendipita sp. 401]|nr:hypothetical protein FRC19_010430 [Serendipita sp. 401]
MSTIAIISRASVASVSSISRASVASVESTQSVASVQSMATISSMSRASAASVSSIQASLSSALVTQAGHTNSDTVTTASVKPNDDRIKYEPTSAWSNSTSGTGSSSSSPIGVCTNGTKVTETAGAKFTFVFEGTSIWLDIIASTSGGKFTVAVDGGAAMDYSSLQTSNSAGDQCIPSRVVSITNLLEAAHQIVVINGISASGSSGGKLEFNGITYTGKGAFGTPDNQSTRSSAAVIGGSVGGAVGAIVIIGGTIAYFMYRKRRTQSGELANNGGGAGAGAAIDQMSQNTSNPVNNTIASYVVPTAMSSPSTFGNQSLPSQQQQFGYPPQQQYYPLQQQHPYAYQQYGQGSTSQINPAVAPLPSWVQRASQANDSSSPPMRPADAVSMTSATHSQVHMAYGGMANPVNTSNNPMHQPNAFYGTHYTPNQQSYNTGQYQ